MRVLAKRPDRFHEVATLMQTVSIFDKLTIEKSDKDELYCSDSSMPTDERNLIIKAAHLFRQKTQLKFGVKVYLEKNIPTEAGLGGGSGNAATTLWALNQMHGSIATEKQLMSWAGEIGSDISFFFSSGIAYCTGKGECIESQPPLSLKESLLWILKPKEGLSTPEIFKNLKVEECSDIGPLQLRENFYKGQKHCINDLEVPAFKKLPRLNILKSELIKQGFKDVAMSGSGSSLFCFGDHPPQNLPEIKLFPAQFVYRKPEMWYEM